MKRAVVWTAAALSDLRSIFRYIAADNPDTAAGVSGRLKTTAANLGEMPTGRPGRVTGTYEKVAPGLPNILAYEVSGRPEGEVIAILHVIHGARDWPDQHWPES